jgi:putative (di)nucleoside polyphosphate hydrolase
MDLKEKVLPYRPCVGMMILSPDREKILVGKRVDSKANAWQMPQGGINLGETPSKAALREMKEEVGTDNAVIVAESRLWYSYDVPKVLIPRLWNGNYRGQKQKWFLLHFHGSDDEIDIHTSNPEFAEWKWMPKENLLDAVIAFKHRLYKAVLKEFHNFL